MRILLIVSSYNGLSQRVWGELTSKGNEVKVQLALSDKVMQEAVDDFMPDLILAPFLKKKIPESIWKNHTCLIVHPGIKGDRGPSSLDWAIMRGEKEWGVTVLKVEEEMDAGDIWSSNNFTMREISKSNLYRHEVTTAALKGIHDAIDKFRSGMFQAEKLDYSKPEIKGTWNDPVKRADRMIDWSGSSKEIIKKIRAADSNPGVLEKNIFPFPCFMFGVHHEDHLKGKAGQLIAQRDKAICIATGDGAVWISHLKKHENGKFKLPATDVLNGYIPDLPVSGRDVFNDDLSGKTFREIRYEEKENVGYLHFDFYNGAMSTDQCRRLRDTFRKIKTRDVDIIVLMGGSDIWSNGINLNTIENASDPADESWDNIVAMNDFVYEVITSGSKYVISAMHGNAGAGGAIMALAADEIIAREGLVLNPHYKKMGLFGSEYWTYLLPKRVGYKVANQLTMDCHPVTTQQAVSIGLIDHASGENIQEFRAFLKERITEIRSSINFKIFTAKKQKQLLELELKMILQDCCNRELREMWMDFYDPDSQYHSLRHAFVNKLDCDQQAGNLRIVSEAVVEECNLKVCLQGL